MHSSNFLHMWNIPSLKGHMYLAGFWDCSFCCLIANVTFPYCFQQNASRITDYRKGWRMALGLRSRNHLGWWRWRHYGCMRAGDNGCGRRVQNRRRVRNVCNCDRGGGSNARRWQGRRRGWWRKPLYFSLWRNWVNRYSFTHLGCSSNRGRGLC